MPKRKYKEDLAARVVDIMNDDDNMFPVEPAPDPTWNFSEGRRILPTFEESGRKVGELVDTKNKAYGDSFSKSGEILALLYPNGAQPSQYKDMLTITRVIDKLFRIATDKDALGESPWKDIAGYALLSLGKQ